MDNIIAVLKECYGVMDSRKLADCVLEIIHEISIDKKMDASFRKALRQLVPADRAQWFADDVEVHLRYARARLTNLSARAVAIAKDPKMQATVGGAAAGAVTLGSVGGGVGCVSGAVVGGAVGVVPAIFTFGLSIPVMSAVGGGMGLVLGAAAGGGTGLAVGGATGYGGYAYRHQIKESVAVVKAKVA